MLGFAMLGPRGTLGLCPRELSRHRRHRSREPTGPDVLFLISVCYFYSLAVGPVRRFIV